MNKEFHYYITYYLARKAGLPEEDCYLLSYSSQMIDDNNTVYKIYGENGVYENYISQSLNILKPEHKLMRIYICFHFIPGDYEHKSAYRKDGKLHLLNTTPHSTIAQKLLIEALTTKNIYRIGIALHSYADTWAHQNFTGINDYINSNRQFFGLFLPNIAHADFIYKPDVVNLVWDDTRLIPSKQKVNNQERFLDASRHVYLILKAYNKGKDMGNLNKIVSNNNDPGWKGIEKELRNATGSVFTCKENTLKRKRKRIDEYKKLLNNNFKPYNIQEWFRAAVHTKVRGLKDRPKKLGRSPLIPDIYTMKTDFKNSHWYKFQEAVKEHQDFVKKAIKPRLEKMELDNF